MNERPQYIYKQKRPIYDKRDLYMTKETYIWQKRPIYDKRDLHMTKETFSWQKRKIQKDQRPK